MTYLTTLRSTQTWSNRPITSGIFYQMSDIIIWPRSDQHKLVYWHEYRIQKYIKFGRSCDIYSMFSIMYWSMVLHIVHNLLWRQSVTIVLAYFNVNVATRAALVIFPHVTLTTLRESPISREPVLVYHIQCDTHTIACLVGALECSIWFARYLQSTDFHCVINVCTDRPEVVHW